MQSTRQRNPGRREELIQIATRMFARNGSRGTTLGDIAKAAGIAQATVVYHFGTKDELLHAVLDARDSFEDALLWRLGPDPGMRIFQAVADIVAEWEQNAEIVGLMGVLIAENLGDDGALRPRLAENYRATVERIASTLRSAQGRGEMRDDVDPTWKATEILAFLSGLELAWLVSPNVNAAEVAASWAKEQTRNLTPQLAD